MRVTSKSFVEAALGCARRRLASEEGFTVLIALGILVVSSLLVAASFAAVNGDIHSSQHDLDGKRAFYAARAGVNRFLSQVNSNQSFWKTCPTQSKTAVPGSQNQSYSYIPLPANNKPSCSSSDPITTMIDQSTGTFQMEFIGYSGNPEVRRGIVASFRKDSPLDFLWYTKYEALDPSIQSGCDKFYRQTRPSSCNIEWIDGDVVSGPMYTQDQYDVRSTDNPVFGRTKSDKIASAATGTSPNTICQGTSCGGATLNGTPLPNSPYIDPPPDNQKLSDDATSFGKVYTGVTTIFLNGTTATINNCKTSTCVTTSNLSLTANPIIYVGNNACTPSTYTPYGATYDGATSAQYPFGCSGNVYVYGTYSTPVTIAAANDIIIGQPRGLSCSFGTCGNDDITTSHDGSGNPTGTAVLGLVANRYVRIMHGVDPRQYALEHSSFDNHCDRVGTTSDVSNVPSQTDRDPVIDAAILAIDRSYIVDNYDCGARLGDITINGAIAQLFRGRVYGDITGGYLKDYGYDDRLAYLQPPYMFDIANSSWHVARETLCVPGGSDPLLGC